jgi:hypothetical protein
MLHGQTHTTSKAGSSPSYRKLKWITLKIRASRPAWDLAAAAPGEMLLIQEQAGQEEQ